MACTVTNMNVTLPPLRILFSASSLPSPLPSPTADDNISFAAAKTNSQHDALYSKSRLPFPRCSPSHADHSRRISTSSVDSNSSAPSLVYSPSPSPPPSPTASPPPFLLIPCELSDADAVVVISSLPTSAAKSSSSPQAAPVFRPCKPSEAKATLLIGPAISAHSRKCRTASERRMHPYRLVRDNRV